MNKIINIFKRLGFEKINGIDKSNLSNYDSDIVSESYSNKFYLKDKEDLFFLNKSKNLKILDIGCGGGRTTFSLYNLGFNNIIAGDYSNRMIEKAKNNSLELKIEENLFYVIDATNLETFKDDIFDIVFFSYNGIDYIPSIEYRLKAFKEINRVLKKGGSFFYSFHNTYWFSVYRLINLIRTFINGYLFSGYEIEKNEGGFLFTKYSSFFKEKKYLNNIGFELNNFGKYNSKKDFILNYMLYIEAFKK
ncbi:class I SAM-dependent methyltransferase [Candidatus Gracilibacteria bacterium]|nr:class I SAM-dependent methyltransferase [Candidatus Gracilibacteria bacterium]